MWLTYPSTKCILHIIESQFLVCSRRPWLWKTSGIIETQIAQEKLKP